MADDAATVEQLRAELRQYRDFYEAAQREIDVQRRSLAAAAAREAALADVLRVIASSPTDLTRVLDTVAEHAYRLGGASSARIYLVEEEALRMVSSVAGREEALNPAVGPGWVGYLAAVVPHSLPSATSGRSTPPI
jgi:hypothetical protein